MFEQAGIFDLIDTVPFWALFVGTVVLVLFSIWVGNRVGHHAPGE